MNSEKVQKNLKRSFSIIKGIETVILFGIIGYSLSELTEFIPYYLLLVLSVTVIIVNAVYYCEYLKKNFDVKHERDLCIGIGASYFLVMGFILLTLEYGFTFEKSIESTTGNVTLQGLRNYTDYNVSFENHTTEDSLWDFNEKINHPAAIAKNNLQRTKQRRKPNLQKKNSDLSPDKEVNPKKTYIIIFILVIILILLQALVWIITSNINLEPQNFDVETGNPENEEIVLQSLPSSRQESEDVAVVHRSRRPSRSDSTESTEETEIENELEIALLGDYTPSEASEGFEHPTKSETFAVIESSRQKNEGSDCIVSSEQSHQKNEGNDPVSSEPPYQDNKEIISEKPCC